MHSVYMGRGDDITTGQGHACSLTHRGTTGLSVLGLGGLDENHVLSTPLRSQTGLPKHPCQIMQSTMKNRGLRTMVEMVWNLSSPSIVQERSTSK